MVTLESVKTYIRVDNCDEDALLQSLMDASESYMEGAVDNYTEKYAASNEKWRYKADLVRLMLIADWYTNRLQAERPVSGAVNMLITQLQLEGAMHDESE